MFVRDFDGAKAHMNMTPAAAHGRIVLIAPRQGSLGDEESGSDPDRLATVAQAPRQPTSEDPALTYGCVDWYLYPKDTLSSDKGNAD
jgi:hypothetical protein